MYLHIDQNVDSNSLDSSEVHLTKDISCCVVIVEFGLISRFCRINDFFYSLIWLTFTIELNEKNVTYYLLKIFPNLSVNFSVYVVSRASINFYILLQKESISQLIRDTFRNFSFVILLIVYSIIQS